MVGVGDRVGRRIAELVEAMYEGRFLREERVVAEAVLCVGLVRDQTGAEHVEHPGTAVLVRRVVPVVSMAVLVHRPEERPLREKSPLGLEVARGHRLHDEDEDPRERRSSDRTDGRRSIEDGEHLIGPLRRDRDHPLQRGQVVDVAGGVEEGRRDARREHGSHRHERREGAETEKNGAYRVHEAPRTKGPRGGMEDHGEQSGTEDPARGGDVTEEVRELGRTDVEEREAPLRRDFVEARVREIAHEQEIEQRKEGARGDAAKRPFRALRRGLVRDEQPCPHEHVHRAGEEQLERMKADDQQLVEGRAQGRHEHEGATEVAPEAARAHDVHTKTERSHVQANAVQYQSRPRSTRRAAARFTV